MPADVQQLQEIARALAHTRRLALLDTIYGYMLIGIPTVLGTAAIAMLGSAVHQAAKEAGGAIKSGLAYLRQGGRMVDQHNAYRDRRKRSNTTPDKAADSSSTHPAHRWKPNPEGMFKSKPGNILTDETRRGIGNADIHAMHATGGGKLNDVTIDAGKFSQHEAHSILDQVQTGGGVWMNGKDGGGQYYRKIHQDGVGERYIDITDMRNQDVSRTADQGRYDGLPVHSRADILHRAYHAGEEEQS